MNQHINNNKTSFKDIFLYLAIVVTLITSVTNYFTIIFRAIEEKWKDTALTIVNSYSNADDESVRFAIASLCVMFPLYLLFSYIVSQDITKFLYKKDLLIRKIVIYATLFITTFTCIGVLISVIYTYLGGDLSMRFAMKALAVLSLAVLTLGYYYYAYVRNYAKKTYIPILFGVGSFALVAVLVVWSVMLIGTPSQVRNRKIDSVRLSNLSDIQGNIVNTYVQNKNTLPSKLADLNNVFSAYVAPVDPVTKEAYEYKIIQQPNFRTNYTTGKKEMESNAVFELCANFITERNVGDEKNMPIQIPLGGNVEKMYAASSYYYDGDTAPFWNHKSEKTCFKRVMTPDMYYGK